MWDPWDARANRSLRVTAYGPVPREGWNASSFKVQVARNASNTTSDRHANDHLIDAFDKFFKGAYRMGVVRRGGPSTIAPGYTWLN